MQLPIRNFSRLNRRQSRLMVFSVVAGLSFSLLLAFFASSTEAGPKIGKLPKESVANRQMQMLDGRQFSLAGLRGKVVVLDFFAVWCGHSREHIPTMTKFGSAEQERGLQIVGLAVKDSQSAPERVRKFLDEMKIAYPVGMISDPDFVSFVESKDVSVPQTLVYARDGRLIAHFSGHDDAIASELAATVKRELEKQ
jgi:thiol-disulfide isomerase/thioredoxin